MNYSYEVEIKNFELSIEKFIDLEKFIQQKLNTKNIKTEIFLFCGPRKIHEDSLFDIFNNKEIKENFSETTSIYAKYYNADFFEEQIILNLINTTELKSLRIQIESKSETTALGNKNLFEKFLSKNFTKKYTTDKTNETLSSNEHSSCEIISKNSNEPLTQYIDSIILSKEDLFSIEDIILQDLDLVHNYKCLVTLRPTEKYIEKNPNTKEHSFTTVREIENNENI